MTTVNVVSPTTRTVRVSPTAQADQYETFVFTFQGSLSAYTGTGRLYLETPYAITSARFSLGGVADGNTTFNIMQNGTTSIFSTPPVLATGQNTTYVNTGFAVSEFARNDFLTVNIVGVSLSQPGSDLTVTIRVRRLA